MEKAQKSSKMGMFTLGIILMESLKDMVNITGRISHSSKVISSNFDSDNIDFCKNDEKWT